MRKLIPLLFLTLVSFAISAQEEKIDQDAISKIRNEGLNNSKVMEIAFNLTDISGPRLTNSPGYNRAANWAINEMKKWGLVNAELEPWGEFGKGWELNKVYIAMRTPYYKPIIGFPKTWTNGTNGLQQAEILLVTAKDSVQMDQYRGKLKGKIIVINRNDTLKPSFRADASRFTEAELDRMANAGPAAPRSQDSVRRAPMAPTQLSNQLINRLKEWALAEGGVAMLSMSPRGHDGTLFVSGGGSYAASAPGNFPDIMIAFEDYMSIVRMVNANQPVKIEVDVQTTYFNKDTKGYNVIAEIPGSDPTLKAEIVMLGGHLDSWQGSTGATDNASGCAVMMEAVRIIKATGLKPRRTIRIALWSGEEQGLHGSRNYVKNHFADPATMELKPAHEKFSVYFNMDNGTGRFRGIYMQGNEKVKPIFSKWLEPFHDMDAKTVTINNTGGTDHLAFDAIGLPGFQFIQDRIEYDTRTHHTNMDSYDHLLEADLKQNAVIAAAFVYMAANRDEKIPRKELPKPRGQTQRGF